MANLSVRHYRMVKSAHACAALWISRVASICHSLHKGANSKTAYYTHAIICCKYPLIDYPSLGYLISISLPKSSAFSWMTIERPATLYSASPVNFTWVSAIKTTALPSGSAAMLPRSPTCLSSEFGPPWSF